MNIKIERKPKRPIYPTPAGLVVSVDATGKPNIITLGEIFNLSIGNPVWVGIAVHKARYSYGLIKEQGEFTVNLPTATMVSEVRGCGSCSGRNGIDKFARFNLTPLPSKYIKPPYCRVPCESGMQSCRIPPCRGPRFVHRRGPIGASR